MSAELEAAIERAWLQAIKEPAQPEYMRINSAWHKALRKAADEQLRLVRVTSPQGLRELFPGIKVSGG